MSTALGMGVVPAELAGVQAVRSALVEQMGGVTLSSAEWTQVRAGVTAGVARAARARRSLAGECRACGAPVWWVETEATGARMPVDPLPHPQGTFVFTTRSRRLAVVRAVPPAAELTPAVKRWRAHFATCPRMETKRRNRQGPKGCATCGMPLHQLLYEAGEVRHPGCESETQTAERVRRETAQDQTVHMEEE